MTAQPRDTGTVVQRYAERVDALSSQIGPRADGLDEWLSPLGEDAHSRLRNLVEDNGTAGLLTRRATARRYVREDGLTYGTLPDGRPRQWQLDPLPVVLGNQEWRTLERGLVQRAMLFDALLADLYGPRRMISEGALPAAAVFGHDGFLPAADGITLPGERQLVMTSVDLARDTDGRWTVIADRDQAPSGAGYAMADRRILARTMPRLYRSTPLARLRGFFDLMSDALHDAAPAVDQPHIALLSPGPESETAFDQAFLASLLGLPLVLAEDLTMRDGRVWRRTTRSPQRVDVLIRRVDAAWSDPLDLRGESRLGVPGLTEAARRRTISVVNPLGTGVLENPALVPYLPDIARRLLGEELILPDVRSWWFGEPSARAEQLDRLADLVIKPISRGTGDPATRGWELSRDELATLRAQIEAEPWKWAAQEQIAMSTAPVIETGGLEPRRLVVRTFGVGGDDGYRFMPGGLGRVSTDAASWDVSNHSGGIAKDIWVLAPGQFDPDAVIRARPRDGVLLPVENSGISLAPRVADDLFWWGRYAERAEATARLLLVTDDLVADHLGRSGSPGQVAMHEMLQTTARVTAVSPTDPDQHPADYLRLVAFQESLPGTLAFAVDQLVRTAYAVRELLSPDTWGILSRLQTAMRRPDGDDEPLPSVLAHVLERLVALSGLGAENIVRDEVWSFMDLGRRLERATQLSALLRVAVGTERSPVADGQITEATLRACDSVITFRRRLAAGTGPAAPIGGMLQLLLRDPLNPRSMEFQIDRMRAVATQFDDQPMLREIERLDQTLRSVSPDVLSTGGRADLTGFTVELTTALRGLNDLITSTYFRRPTPSQRFTGSHQIGVRQ